MDSTVFGRYPTTRLRRNRRDDWSRRLFAENSLSIDDLIWPIFVHDNDLAAEPVASMPGVERLPIAMLVDAVEEAAGLGIPMVALFPANPPDVKSPDGEEATNPDNLVCRAVRAIKRRISDIGVMCDVALDPYTSHGQDGLVRDNYVVNDETVRVLCDQALVQAAAGCDVIAPSDMMDGRIGAIRAALDTRGLRARPHRFLCRKIRLGLLTGRSATPSVRARTSVRATSEPIRWIARTPTRALREVALDLAEGADACHGQAWPALSRHHPAGQRPLSACRRRLIR